MNILIGLRFLSLTVTLCSILVDFSFFKGKYSWLASSVRRDSFPSTGGRRCLQSFASSYPRLLCASFSIYVLFPRSIWKTSSARNAWRQFSCTIFFFPFFLLTPPTLARPPPPLHYGRTNSYGSLKADWPLQPSEENTSQALKMSWTLRSGTFLPLIREWKRKVSFFGKGSSLASPRIYLPRRLIINLSLRRTRL